MRLSSIRARMTLGLTLFVALLTFVVGTSLWLRNYVGARNQSLELLQTTTERVRAATRRGQSWETIAASVRGQNFSSSVGEIEIWHVGPDDSDLSPAPPLGAFGALPPGAPNDDKTRKPPPPDRLVPSLSDPRGWFSRRIPQGQNSIIVAVPWHKVRHGLSNQAFALVLLGLLTSAASGLGAWVLVGRTLAPIERLAAQARTLAQEGLGAGEIVLQAPSPDHEVQELVSTFNALLGSVAQGARQRERFHAAASHELRTPLQALSGTLQLALSRPRSGEEYHSALQASLSQAGRLNALTRDLLTLNQLEFGASKPPREMVDIAEECDLSLSSLQDTIARKKLNLAESLAPLEVLAPPSHIAMLCRNLLENAAKYTPIEGTIRVETIAENNRPHLRIWNQTTGPIEGDLDAWCEPFFRPDEARTSTIGGNGLGLAICRALCDANNWSLHLESTMEANTPGVRATVHFL